MPTNLPVKLIPVQLGVGYCPATYQQFNEDIMRAEAYVEIGTVSFIITQPTPPDETVYPEATWCLIDGNNAPVRFYRWSDDKGFWISPHPIPASSPELRPWTGTLENLKKYETDHADDWEKAPSVVDGPFWELVPELVGRIPIGVNDATTGGPDVTLPQYSIGQQNTGSASVPLGSTLLEFSNLPQHAHAIGVIGDDDPDPAAGGNDNLYSLASLTTVPTSTWGISSASLYRVPGGQNTFTAYSFDFVNAWTFDAWTNVTSTRVVEPASTLGPVTAVHWMRRTIRAYYSAT